jgi:hypothetical protein
VRSSALVPRALSNGGTGTARQTLQGRATSGEKSVAKFVVMDAGEQRRADEILTGIKSADWSRVRSSVDSLIGPEDEMEKWFLYFCDLISRSHACYGFEFYQTPDGSRVYKHIVTMSDRDEVIFCWISDIENTEMSFRLLYPSGPLDEEGTVE